MYIKTILLFYIVVFSTSIFTLKWQYYLILFDFTITIYIILYIFTINAEHGVLMTLSKKM